MAAAADFGRITGNPEVNEESIPTWGLPTTRELSNRAERYGTVYLYGKRAVSSTSPAENTRSKVRVGH